MKRAAIILAGLALLLVGGALWMAGGALLATDDHPARQAPQAMQARLREHVEALCALPRYGDSLTNAQKYIIHQLEKAGWEVFLQDFNTGQGERFQNICAVRRGQKPSALPAGSSL